MLLLLDVYALKCATNYILLSIVKNPNIGYIECDYVYIHIIVS
jgi:hypothetical protein